MIDTVLNLLFRCSHKRLSMPQTAARRAGAPPETTYVVCFECGKHFEYSTQEMRIVRPLDNPKQPAPGPR